MFKVHKIGTNCSNYFKQNCTLSSECTLSQVYEPVIGLEVHVQILADSKLFSDAGTQFVARPNSQVAHLDLSLPGTLPVLNRSCVETAIRTAIAHECSISPESRFDRKHYFYGDMPCGYQITQQQEPIAYNGSIEFIVYDESINQINRIQNKSLDPYMKKCRLKQIQLEQDSGKSLVDLELNQNLIDLNRAGVALMEFVFEPELCSSLEAVCLVHELINRLQAINGSNCRMEEGSVRIDANVSIKPLGSSTLGTRTEIKNLNSFRFLRQAIDYEIDRQARLLNNNQVIINETLGFDFRTRKTFPMRDKEIVQDYRFFPEPNLPSILLNDSAVNEISNNTLIDIHMIRTFINEQQHSQLPQTIRKHLMVDENTNYQLTLRELTSPESMFDEPWQVSISADQLLTIINLSYLAELADLLIDGDISEPTAYDIVKLYIQKDDRKPRIIVQQYNWHLINDRKHIETICREVTKQIPKVAKKYAKTGIRKPKSMLIQNAQLALGNRGFLSHYGQLNLKILSFC
ncbi:hypothetical protein BLOT_001737 [Blomia tropicalis]|nr:hypothetical protein BLOT_001737 [Blomia tropicalis]